MEIAGMFDGIGLEASVEIVDEIKGSEQLNS
jgi:hypothetical protein